MKNTFSEIKPQGGMKLGDLPKTESGATEAWSGDIVAPLSFSPKNCLSQDEWSSLFFTLVHEGMHSTDGVFTRLITRSDITDSHHHKIHHRVSYEKMRPIGEPGLMWGKPRPTPVN